MLSQKKEEYFTFVFRSSWCALARVVSYENRTQMATFGCSQIPQICIVQSALIMKICVPFSFIVVRLGTCRLLCSDAEKAAVILKSKPLLERSRRSLESIARLGDGTCHR
jgi:hypothetical protein